MEDGVSYRIYSSKSNYSLYNIVIVNYSKKNTNTITKLNAHCNPINLPNGFIQICCVCYVSIMFI